MSLRVAVIGAGAFGRNHLRVYRELEGAPSASDTVALAAVVDPNPDLRQRSAEQYGVAAFASVRDLLAANLQLDAASICVPTVHHASVASQLLRAGFDILIEKPFAATLTEADEVLQLADSLDRIVQIGHLERFNPAVTAAASRLNQPMFFEAHRLSIFTPRSLDVDVVLDLMIHDLDIVLTFANSPVREVRAVGLPVLSPKVDIANVRVEFDSGCVANFTASRVSTEQVRKLRFFQPHEYLSLDFARQELLSIQVDPALLAQQLASHASPPAADRSPQDLSSRPDASRSPHNLSSRPDALRSPQNPSSRPERDGEAGSRSGETPVFRDLPDAAGSKATGFSPSTASHNAEATHPSRGLTLTKLDPPRAEPLRLEIEDFLGSVRSRHPPRVTAAAGRAALALALEINAQIAAHARRAGLA